VVSLLNDSSIKPNDNGNLSTTSSTATQAHNIHNTYTSTYKLITCIHMGTAVSVTRHLANRAYRGLEVKLHTLTYAI